MTIQFFIILLAALCTISSLFTEAVKKGFRNKQLDPSANLIAAVSAALVGGVGSVMAYIWFNIAFSPANIVAIIAMVFLIWIGSMIGYDKIIQLVKQLSKTPDVE